MDKQVDRDVDMGEVVLSTKLKRSWGWLLMLGIVFVLLGMVGLSMTVSTTVFSMYFFAVLLFLAGFSQLADAWRSREWHGILWHGLIAVLYMFVGGGEIYTKYCKSLGMHRDLNDASQLHKQAVTLRL